uniref:HMA domain-containing protein n=1 Tax=Kalanchoe fedtschenkoi TaxID=63787 RepID=A0A7N0UMA3_KALFE
MVSIAASFSSLICTGHIVGTTTSSPSLFTRLRSTRVGGSLTTSSQKLPVVLVRASVEEETLPPEVADQPVSVPVSPSDVLTMFFQAEGTMNETAIPTVTKALEETEGITNLRVQLLEGIASVELTKQTTVQATGVASSLIETIQGSGFKLQTLNLSFEDKDEVVN